MKIWSYVYVQGLRDYTSQPKYILILARQFGISVRHYSIIYKYLLNYMYAKM